MLKAVISEAAAISTPAIWEGLGTDVDANVRPMVLIIDPFLQKEDRKNIVLFIWIDRYSKDSIYIILTNYLNEVTVNERNEEFARR